MIIGVPKECADGECRVSASPGSVKKLTGLGYEVRVEKGAGNRANFPDSYYSDAGAELVDDASDVWSASDIVIKVLVPEDHEIAQMKEGKFWILPPNEYENSKEKFIKRAEELVNQINPDYPESGAWIRSLSRLLV